MFQGSIVALVTPMLSDGSIDWDSLESLIEWHIQAQTSAIVAVGSTGESATLSMEEHREVLRFCVEISKKRIPIIAGSGASLPNKAIALTQFAEKIGCDASLQVTPSYTRPPQRGLYQHFATIAQSVKLPIILYNIPSRTCVDLAPETTIELAKIPNIIGIKEANPIERLITLRRHFPRGNRFKVYSGEDGICAQALSEGYIDGIISVTANIAPRTMQKMMNAGLTGDTAGCLKINEQLAPLHQALFVETNPIPVKWLLFYMNKINSGIRLPLVRLDESHQPALIAALQYLQSTEENL